MLNLRHKIWFESIVSRIKKHKQRSARYTGTNNQSFVSFASSSVQMANALNTFNVIVNSTSSGIDIFHLIKLTLIEELGLPFCAVCLVNNELNALDINLINSGRRIINHLFSLDDRDKALIKALSTESLYEINKEVNVNPGFNIPDYIKELKIYRITRQNNVIGLLVAGFVKKK